LKSGSNTVSEIAYSVRIIAMSGCIIFICFSEQMMIALSPSHHLAGYDPIRFQNLDNERYLNRINCEFNEGLAWRNTA
jgi:hypothetical protein